MDGWSLIDCMGGTSRFITSLTFFIHFIHPLFCIANYCAWVMYQVPVLGESIVHAYLAMSVVAAVFYLAVASVFYMWAWRFPDPEEVSKRRRIYGILVNLLFSDLPLFVIEVKICWVVQFASGIQGTSFVITCISFFYSAVRVWTFFMIKLIKMRAPVVGAQPQFAGSAMYAAEGRGAGPSGYSYNGNVAPRYWTDANGSGDDYRNNTGGFPQGRRTPSDAYRRGPHYADGRYGGDQFSTPGGQSLPRI
ncbi:uncharacterized protein Tco025E_09138 [Trypanosoma conorhini]|uniref:Uncharacterized protein n=1 Tax=Trypanosoma conorhini TaxID=83891 RepID=A0A3R7N266_9TRYP|nr:uncharacterized protein Tco025E_09138 [Trypanosoma conorhini]RNE98828.1 hypothetical protein Tco025E_09138 [Trypanosoma conorhini]